MAAGGDAKWQKDAADQNFDYMFKLLIIGNSSVGKTSFLFRYADDSFTSAFVSTVGIDFKVKTVFRHDKRVKLQIWVSLLPKDFFNISKKRPVSSQCSPFFTKNIRKSHLNPIFSLSETCMQWHTYVYGHSKKLITNTCHRCWFLAIWVRSFRDFRKSLQGNSDVAGSSLKKHNSKICLRIHLSLIDYPGPAVVEPEHPNQCLVDY